MVLYQFFRNYTKVFTQPVSNFFSKRYTQFIKKRAPQFSQQNKDSQKDKQDFFNKYFTNVINKATLSPPTMSEDMAYKILNLDPQKKYKIDQIINKAYSLSDKNDPQQDGSTYIQCKIMSAKQKLLQNFGDSQQVEDKHFTDLQAKLEILKNRTKQEIQAQIFAQLQRQEQQRLKKQEQEKAKLNKEGEVKQQDKKQQSKGQQKKN